MNWRYAMNPGVNSNIIGRPTDSKSKSVFTYQLLNLYTPNRSGLPLTCCPLFHGLCLSLASQDLVALTMFVGTSSYVLVPGTIRLSPILVPGELCLGGHQLARGYLNDQDKTNQSFHQNPFGTGRLYRTGDYAMCHEDGSIEILGRIGERRRGEFA